MPIFIFICIILDSFLSQYKDFIDKKLDFLNQTTAK